MSDKCENCGQPVLETDTICWQCGWRLPQTAVSVAVRSPSTRAEGVVTISLTNVAIYSALTLMVAIALLMTLSSLGRQPLNQIDDELIATANWQTVTDRRREYALRLPPEWLWLDGRDPDYQTDFSAMIALDDRFTAVVAPYGEVETEWELVGVAIDGQPETVGGEASFLLVARDDRRARASAEQIAARLRINDPGYRVANVAMSSEVRGVPRVSSIVTGLDSGRPLRCHQEFIEAPRANYLLAGCSEERRFQLDGSTLRLILDQFQWVSP